MKPRTLIRLFAVLLTLSLAKYLWIAGFAHPVADDYCYAVKSAGRSFMDWSLSEWLYWNGRYASNLLMIHGPLTWFPDMLTGYRLMPPLLLLSTLGAIWFLLRRATAQALSIGQELLGAAMILAIYLNLMPDLGEGFYWYTGAITYQLGSILFLLHLGLLFPGPAGKPGLMRPLLNLASAAIITGMDEVHMLLMCGLHLSRTVWLLTRRRKAGLGIGYLLVVLAGAVLMAVAPGNAVRGGMFAHTHQFWHSLGMSGLQAIRFVGIWCLSPATLTAALLYLPLHARLRRSVPAMERLLSAPGWFYLLLPFALVMATTFPAYWGTGLLGQHRTINVACLLFIPAALLGLGFAIERGPLRRLTRVELSPRQFMFALFLALVAFNFTRNDIAVHADLWDGRLAEYDRVMHDREQVMRNASHNPDSRVTFVRLARPPRTLTSYEVLGPLHDWMMRCQARFFGVREEQVGMASP